MVTLFSPASPFPDKHAPPGYRFGRGPVAIESNLHPLPVLSRAHSEIPHVKIFGEPDDPICL